MFSLYNFAFAFSICCKESLRLFDLQLSPKLLTGLYVSDCVRSLIDKKMDNIILCDAKIIRTMHRAEAELSRADHNWRAGGWDEVWEEKHTNIYMSIFYHTDWGQRRLTLTNQFFGRKLWLTCKSMDISFALHRPLSLPHSRSVRALAHQTFILKTLLSHRRTTIWSDERACVWVLYQFRYFNKITKKFMCDIYTIEYLLIDSIEFCFLLFVIGLFELIWFDSACFKIIIDSWKMYSICV